MNQNMTFEDALSDCFDRLRRGTPLRECLGLYPQYAARLRPLLELSILTYRSGADLNAEVREAQDRGRARLLQQMLAAPAAPPRRTSRWAGLSAVAVLGMVVLFAAALLAAENSLPGDPLYGVKQFSEEVRAGGAAAADEAFAQRRVDEVRTLVALQREGEVGFTGILEAAEEKTWTVRGLTLEVPEGFAPRALVGASVAVQVRVLPEGRLILTGFSAIDPAPLLTPFPTFTPSATAAPSNSPTSTASRTPTVTNTPSAARTPTRTPSPSRTPTHTRTVVLTVTLRPQTTPTGIGATSVLTVCTPKRPDGWVVYAVEGGDTLSELAMSTSTTTTLLREVNCLDPAAFLRTGQLLFLPRTPWEGSGDDDDTGDDDDDDGGDDDDDDSGDDDDDESGDDDDDDDTPPESTPPVG